MEQEPVQSTVLAEKMAWVEVADSYAENWRPQNGAEDASSASADCCTSTCASETAAACATAAGAATSAGTAKGAATNPASSETRNS